MEAMMKEFDRNTAIYLGQVKNVENKEQNINAKKVRNVEDEELEKNRMKIEYIKKLLPSSFGNFVIFFCMCSFILMHIMEIILNFSIGNSEDFKFDEGKFSRRNW